LALYQARGGHSRIDFFVVFPSEIRQMPRNQVAYRANKRESFLSAVLLRPCEPLALIPVNGQKPEIGGQFLDRKIAAARAPGVAGRYLNK
jgi:hypothetical protein